MVKTISILAVSLTGILFSFASVTAQAQSSHPACEYASSDPDGDGYGWENRAPCIVTDTSSVETAPAVCVDDDNDGYGWDGNKVCRIDVMCYDTAPVGDGWGWDGTNSCEIAAYDAQFSELEMLKGESKPGILFGVEIPVATAICDEGVAAEYQLFANGTLRRVAEGETTIRGTWSTGFEDSDGFLHLSDEVRPSWLILTQNSVSTRVRNGDAESAACFWE